MEYQLGTVINFGRYKDLSLAEALSEPGGFDWVFWAINNVNSFKVEPNLIKYVKTTIKLREKDRKVNPQNYLHERRVSDLKQLALSLNLNLKGCKKKQDYVTLIKKAANES